MPFHPPRPNTGIDKCVPRFSRRNLRQSATVHTRRPTVVRRLFNTRSNTLFFVFRQIEASGSPPRNREPPLPSLPLKVRSDTYDRNDNIGIARRSTGIRTADRDSGGPHQFYARARPWNIRSLLDSDDLSPRHFSNTGRES